MLIIAKREKELLSDDRPHIHTIMPFFKLTVQLKCNTGLQAFISVSAIKYSCTFLNNLS